MWYQAIVDTLEPPLLVACESLISFIIGKHSQKERKINDYQFSNSCLHYLLKEVIPLVSIIPSSIPYFLTQIQPLIPPSVSILFDSLFASFICSTLYTLLNSKKKMQLLSDQMNPWLVEFLAALAERLCNLSAEFVVHFDKMELEIGTE